MSASLWTHIGYARVAGIVAERAGLHFAPNRQPAAESAMKRVMRDARIEQPGTFANRLTTDDELLAALVAAVTIGESYFFREPGQLDYIRQHVLPGFRANRTPERPLRAWSAGCATGEEAYTLGIMLHEAGFANSASVLGTDISRPRLEAARRARYTSWSLRGMDEETTDRCFLRRGNQFLLRPELRATVDFRELNLADDGWPSARSGIHGMALILCRNVLIYFERASLGEVAARLLASLSDDGWLFMGASDPMLSDLVPCETIVTGAGLAYRRVVARPQWAGTPTAAPPQPEQAAAAGGSEPSVVSPAALPGAPALPDAPAPTPAALPPRPQLPAAGETGATAAAGLQGSDARLDTAGLDAPSAEALQATALYAGRDYAAAAAAAAAIVSTRPADDRAWVVLVRALANSGRTVDAERACASAMERLPASPELAYLHSVLLAQRGQFAAAASAARRALYLDRTLAVAHLALGRALARLGNRDQAERAFRAAEQALERLAPDATVPLTDGEPAHRLREAARTQRRLLDEVVA